MTMPTGVSLATVTFGKALGALGTEATITATVALDRPIVWAATGETFYAIPDTVAATAGGYLSFAVPHVDQPGFIDAAGNQVTDFAYVLTAQVKFGKAPVVHVTKAFQVRVGQASVDLDLVPGGSITPGVTAPSAEVLSVAGFTGTVTLAQLAAALNVPTPESIAATTYRPQASSGATQQPLFTGRTIDGTTTYNGNTAAAVAGFSIAGSTLSYSGAGAASNGAVLMPNHAWFADGRLSCVVNLTADTSGKWAGLVFRHTGTTALLAVMDEGATGRRLKCYAYTGSFTQILDVAVPETVIAGATQAEIAVEVEGNLLRAYVNGKQVGAATTIPDTHLEAGRAGLIAVQNRVTSWQSISLVQYDYRFASSKATNVLSIGTSLAAGFGLTSPTTENYARRFFDKVKAALGRPALNHYNRGISGALSSAILADLPTGLAERQYDVVTLEVSVNDAKTGGSGGLTVAETRANTLKMIALVKAHGAVPVVFGSPPFSGTAFAPDLTTAGWQKAAEANAAAQQICTEQRVHFVDVVRLLAGDYTTSPTQMQDGLHYRAARAQIVGERGADVYLAGTRR